MHFDTINKIYNGMGSGKILPKVKLFEIKDFLFNWDER